MLHVKFQRLTLVLVDDGGGLRLDGDAPLPLHRQLVQDLLVVGRGLHRAHQLEDAVGQRGLAVVDMRHDAEVAYPLEGHRGGVEGAAASLVFGVAGGGRVEEGREGRELRCL